MPPTADLTSEVMKIPGRITKHKITGTIDASGNIDVYSANVVRGHIVAVQIDYPAATVEVDLKTGEAVEQVILDLAAANTDRTVYPVTPLHDYTGTAIDLSDAQGGDTAQNERFCVFGRLRLVCASGTATQVVTVHVYVEEY